MEVGWDCFGRGMAQPFGGVASSNNSQDGGDSEGGGELAEAAAAGGGDWGTAASNATAWLSETRKIMCPSSARGPV